MTAHPVDIHIGQKLKSRRITMGMSQSELGKLIGVTFQQIQKYERGINKVSCSRLYEFAEALRTNIDFFFEGITNLSSKSATYLKEDNLDFLLTEHGIDPKEILALVRSYINLKDENIRRNLAGLIRSIAQAQM